MRRRFTAAFAKWGGSLGMLIIAMAASCFPAAAAENIAEQLLTMDSEVRNVSPQMHEVLKEVMDQGANRAQLRAHDKQPGWDPNYVVGVFRAIDDTLIEHGFVYPDTGLVDQLADGLTPYQMDKNRLSAFLKQPHNLRRQRMISKRFPGPFYVVDCDIASFIYLGVADRLHLPIYLVNIPGEFGDSGHSFVRWREGANYLDWETMDGRPGADGYYLKEFGVTKAEVAAGAAMTDFNREQVLGYENYLLGIQYQRQGNYDAALEKTARALALNPQDLSARNNYAWCTAVGKGLKTRDYATALRDVEYVLKLVDDPDVRDTLAATYASMGNFHLAVVEERAVIQKLPKKEYKERLALYEQGRSYLEEKGPVGPVPVFQP